MTKEELAKEINEIWEIEIFNNGLKSEVAVRLQDLKYDIIKQTKW